MSSKYLMFFKSRWFISVCCIVLGAIIVLGIRVYTYKPDVVHYHANFAIFVNGKREKLHNPLLYEEVEMCTESKTMAPSERAHMHDSVSDVVHVEDHAVTWGHFLQNIGYGVGSNYLSTPEQINLADQTNKLHFMLNGEEVSSVTNRVIGDKDRLLIDFGDTSSKDLQEEFSSIPSTAGKYNVSKDPESCGGHESGSMMDRLQHMF